MFRHLPPLRLTGAEILREGEFRQRSVAVARGRITRGPLPAVDLSGFLILPGIVDLAGDLHRRHLRPRQHGPAAAAEAVAAAEREAAANGITTACLAQGWSWEGGDSAPDLALEVMAAVAGQRRHGGTDLRVQLLADTHAVAERGRLLAAVARGWVSGVIFASAVQVLEAVSAAEFQRHALALGTGAGELRRGLEAAIARRGEVPRHLCDLAEAFDVAGVLYGSRADMDGQEREHYSMIGARLAVFPAAYAAAAAARAMGDPVVLAGPDLLHDPAAPPPVAADVLRAGHCDALASNGWAPSLLQAAFALADRGIMPLERSWALVSERPAEILRLADRGTLQHGRRADLVIVERETRRVGATIAGGVVTYMAGEAVARFAAAGLEGEPEQVIARPQPRPAPHAAGHPCRSGPSRA